MVASGTYNSIINQSRKRKKEIETYAITLADIDKALAPKKIVNPRDHMPKWLGPEFEINFKPGEANKLPIHRSQIDHHIPLEKDINGVEKPVPWCAMYNNSRDELLVLRKTLTELLEKNFICVSKSSAGAPVLFVKKPGGGLRFCVDYRALNAITKKDRYPLPLIRETLRAVSQAKYLTKLDVSQAFHQIRMAKGEEWKTAFRMRYGLYEWNVLPFGLTGAPATFQRYINWLLRDHLDDFCTAYIDDILIFSSGSREDHQEKVKIVLRKLQDGGLTLDIMKCEFEVKKTKYLGYIIDVDQGIRMDPEKVKAIREWEIPKTVKGVRGFLGFANFYRTFIKNYSDLVLPLTRLTQKDIPFVFDNECKRAFSILKEKFVMDPILAIFDPDRRTVLEPDASNWAVGGVLSQYDNNGILRPVAFFSKKNLPAECNYPIHDKELLAIIRCLEEWDAELRSTKDPFLILTDHRNLEHFMQARHLNERQMRWAQTLSRYNYQLNYRPGNKAVIPDALSRREQDIPEHGDNRLDYRITKLLPNWNEVVKACSVIAVKIRSPFEDEELKDLWNKALEEDMSYTEIRKTVESTASHWPTTLKIQGVELSQCTVDEQGVVHRSGKIWIPNYEPLRTKIIQTLHDSQTVGHPGRDNMIDIVGRQFFWPGVSQDIKRFTRNCDVCGSATIWRQKRWGLPKPLPVPDRIWRSISMDFITELPKVDECDACLVITDRLSKGVIFEPVCSMTAEATADIFIRSVYRHHGLPIDIVSDRGTQWVNVFWKRVCEQLNITRRLSTAFHPQTDGSTERMNQELQQFIRVFCSYEQTNWKDLLPHAELAINNRSASSTKISPFFLTHGFHLEPIELVSEPTQSKDSDNPVARGERLVAKLKDAREFAEAAIAAAQQNYEQYANYHRVPAHRFRAGDKVWLHLKNIKTDRPSKKFDWIHAKYEVIEPVSTHAYRLNTPTGIHNVFHVSLLQPVSKDPLPSQKNVDAQPPAIVGEENQKEYYVEKILKARSKKIGRGVRREALVKWLGYVKPTWEPIKNIDNTEALDEFEKKYGSIETSDGPKDASAKTKNKNKR
ncbi:Transposon Ty3-G Gag-Pol polyprotein [Podosphaera aphanis]|nr:Transposon Ty3-G Gag-Pol polyprotein [Podosphaera aphanis]